MANDEDRKDMNKDMKKKDREGLVCRKNNWETTDRLREREF